MERRQFLKLLYAVPVFSGLLVGPGAIHVCNAGAGTAFLAMINFSLAVQGLFSKSGGTSILDLMKLQSEMLKTISEQVKTVQDTLTIVIDRLDDIEKHIKGLPKKVVDELYTRRLHGVVGRFREITRTYKEDKRVSGSLVAQNNIKDELENEVIKPLREIRSVLFFDRDSDVRKVLLPFIANALYIEVNAMIMNDYRPTRIIEAIKTYRFWITELVYGKGEYKQPWASCFLSCRRVNEDERENYWGGTERVPDHKVSRGGIYRTLNPEFGSIFDPDEFECLAAIFRPECDPETQEYKDRIKKKAQEKERVERELKYLDSLLKVGESAVSFCDSMVEDLEKEIA